MDIDFSALEGMAAGGEPVVDEEGPRYLVLEKGAKDARRSEAIWRQAAENIRASETLRRELMLGAKAGMPLQERYRLAIACIVAMTGDTMLGERAWDGLGGAGE